MTAYGPGKALSREDFLKFLKQKVREWTSEDPEGRQARRIARRGFSLAHLNEHRNDRFNQLLHGSKVSTLGIQIMDRRDDWYIETDLLDEPQ